MPFHRPLLLPTSAERLHLAQPLEPCDPPEVWAVAAQMGDTLLMLVSVHPLLSNCLPCLLVFSPQVRAVAEQMGEALRALGLVLDGELPVDR